MRYILTVLLFCVMGCAETHTPFDGDAGPPIVTDDGGGIEGDSAVDPREDSGIVSPDAHTDTDAGVDAGDPGTCGTLPRDESTRHRVVADTNDCDGPFSRLRFLDVMPYGEGAARCNFFTAEVTSVCGTSLQTFSVGGIWLREGLTYTSEAFEMGCEGVSYMCSVVHDATSNDVSLRCDYSGLTCEAHFARE